MRIKNEFIRDGYAVLASRSWPYHTNDMGGAYSIFRTKRDAIEFFLRGCRGDINIVKVKIHIPFTKKK